MNNRHKIHTKDTLNERTLPRVLTAPIARAFRWYETSCQSLIDFFSNDCFANASIRVDDLPNARKKKIETDIPHVKSLKDYPAVLLGRLGVAQEFQSKHIGSDVLNFVKFWFVEPNNKTGCRFVIVDAYNNPSTLAFYQRNGFKTVFSTDEQEKDYRHIDQEVALSSNPKRASARLPLRSK